MCGLWLFSNITIVARRFSKMQDLISHHLSSLIVSDFLTKKKARINIQSRAGTKSHWQEKKRWGRIIAKTATHPTMMLSFSSDHVRYNHMSFGPVKCKAHLLVRLHFPNSSHITAIHCSIVYRSAWRASDPGKMLPNRLQVSTKKQALVSPATVDPSLRRVVLPGPLPPPPW